MVAEKVKLGDIEDRGLIRLGRGKVISKEDMLKEPGDYPVYSSSASGTGEFGRYGQYMFDDIRISWSVDGGGKFFYRDDDRYSITNVCGWIQNLAPDKIDLKYLYYALSAEWSDKSYDYSHKAHPSVIRNEYTLFMPPLPEQRRIAAVLSNLDDYIEKQEKLIEKNKKFRDGVLEELIPKCENADWAYDTLGKYIVLVSGIDLEPYEYNNQHKGIPYITGASNFSNGHILENRWTTSPKRISFKGDLLITCKGTVGEMAFNDFEQAHIARQVMAIKPANDSVLLDFIKICLDSLVESIKASANGIIPGIERSTILDARIPILPLNEQQRIASIMSDLDDNIAKQQEKLDKARKLKDALLNDLISGKIRLTDDKK